MPNINYIWVGPPPNSKSGGVAGHDILGPVNMSKQIDSKSTIRFWCLSEYASYYKAKFRGQKIEVCSIEPYLKELTERLQSEVSESAKSVLSLINTALEPSKRNKIRDRVSVKEGFGLFLLYTQGGYILDTNIVPNSNSVQFLEYDTVYLPAFKSSIKCTTDVDAWMIYSPKSNPTRIKLSLDRYLKMWFHADKNIFEAKGYDKSYFLACGTIFMQSVLLTTHGKTGPSLDNIEFWPTKAHKSLYYVIVPTIGVKKYYYNTHKEENYMDKAIPQIYFDITYGDPQKLIVLLENGEPVNQTTNAVGGVDETPLHYAVRANKPDMVKVLLKFSPDITKIATYNKKFKFTALELASKTGKSDCKRLIEEYERKQIEEATKIDLSMLQRQSGSETVQNLNEPIEKFVFWGRTPEHDEWDKVMQEQKVTDVSPESQRNYPW